MKSWVKEHWPEILVLGVVFGVLFTCVAPSATWINTDSDGIHYVYAAKYLYPAHKTSAPLYLLLGHMFLWIPTGTDFWRMALLSIIASTISAWFIYRIVRDKTSKLYGIIAALVFGGSALVISQSTIVDSYALVTMFGIGAYYFATKEKWLYCALMLGAGSAVHHLIFIPLVVMLIFYKGLRKWKYIGVMSAFLLFYLYIPITMAVNNPPNMWGNSELNTFMADNTMTALMLIGGLSIWDLPKRIFDALGILGVSLTLALIPLVYFLVKRKWYKEPLFWMFILYVIYYATDLAPQTYVYMTPAIGFGAIMAGIGLKEFPILEESYLYPSDMWWTSWLQVKWFVLIFAVVMLISNTIGLNIGTTLDPKLEATKYYTIEMNKVPDGEVLMPSHDWEWAAILPYNKDNNRNIVPICIGVLASRGYRENLQAQGINTGNWDITASTMGWNPSQLSMHVANYIIENNDNVWTTVTTNASNYGAEVIKANIVSNYFAPPPEIIPTWQFKPSNPYGIITGSIEVEQWVNIIQSNYNCATFFMLGMIGVVPIWIGWNIIVKKKKWSLRKSKREVTNNA